VALLLGLPVVGPKEGGGRRERDEGEGGASWSELQVPAVCRGTRQEEDDGGLRRQDMVASWVSHRRWWNYGGDGRWCHRREELGPVDSNHGGTRRYQYVAADDG
jgi:hypothetical protein